MKPCPIAFSYGWLSVSQSLWLVDAAQTTAFPAKKEGKKANNGMMLRKRKAGVHAAPVDVIVENVEVVGEPPNKRARITRNSGKAKARVRQDASAPAIAPVEAEDELLSKLLLPVLTVSVDQDQEEGFAPSTSSDHAAKATLLELMGVDAPLTSSIIVDASSAAVSQTSSSSSGTLSPPEPTRRSARQATRRPTISSSTAPANIDAMSPTSDITALDSPSVSPVALVADLTDPVVARPVVGRARSSSSSCGSASTVVSETSSSGAETAVEPEDEKESVSKAGSKRKRGLETVVEEEKVVPVRASTRVRKPAAKKIEATAAEDEPVNDVQDTVAKKIAAASTTSSAKKTSNRTRQRTNSRRA